MATRAVEGGGKIWYNRGKARGYANAVVGDRPEWAWDYAREAERIAAIPGDNFVSIRQHRLARRADAGRQAPAGILPAARGIAAVTFASPRLPTSAGTAMGEFGTPGRHYFHTGGGERGRRAYIFAADNRAAIERPLAAPSVCALIRTRHTPAGR